MGDYSADDLPVLIKNRKKLFIYGKCSEGWKLTSLAVSDECIAEINFPPKPSSELVVSVLVSDAIYTEIKSKNAHRPSSNEIAVLELKKIQNRLQEDNNKLEEKYKNLEKQLIEKDKQIKELTNKLEQKEQELFEARKMKQGDEKSSLKQSENQEKDARIHELELQLIEQRRAKEKTESELITAKSALLEQKDLNSKLNDSLTCESVKNRELQQEKDTLTASLKRQVESQVVVEAENNRLRQQVKKFVAQAKSEDESDFINTYQHLTIFHKGIKNKNPRDIEKFFKEREAQDFKQHRRALITYVNKAKSLLAKIEEAIREQKDDQEYKDAKLVLELLPKQAADLKDTITSILSRSLQFTNTQIQRDLEDLKNQLESKPVVGTR